MQYEVSLPTDDHDATWLEHYETDGGLNFYCRVEGGVVLISAGWGHIDHCPVCGTSVDLTTTEVDR